MNKTIFLSIIIGLSLLVMLFYRSTLDLEGFYRSGTMEAYPLNEQQKSWLENDNNYEMRIGVPDDTAPLFLWNEKGEPEGFLKDYVDFIADSYKIRTEY